MPRRKGALSPADYACVREEMYERDGWRCFECGRSDTLTPHHITPRSQGGSDTLENLITLCLDDHQRMDGGQWRAARERLLAWTERRVRLPRRSARGRPWL